jgi:hypothetical protein
VAGLSFVLVGDRSWIFWQAGDDQVLRVLYPLNAVEFYELRDGEWYRFGHRVPSFDIPDNQEAVPIDRAIFPDLFEPIHPGETSPTPSRFRLVRECSRMPSSAALCSLAELARWTDSATTREIELIRGTIRKDQALLLGRDLPFWPGSTRYWGEQVLVPNGFRVRPGLTEKAILDALGASGLEIARFVQVDGAEDQARVELIAMDAFRPLTRAGVRLAMRARLS